MPEKDRHVVLKGHRIWVLRIPVYPGQVRGWCGRSDIVSFRYLIRAGYTAVHVLQKYRDCEHHIHRFFSYCLLPPEVAPLHVDIPNYIFHLNTVVT